MSAERLGGPGLLSAGNEDPYLRGMEYLGGWENTGAAVASSSVVSFPQRDVIMILGRAIWGATAGYLAARVGTAVGSVDSGSNYWHRNVGSLSSGAPTTFYGSSAKPTTQWILQFTGVAIVAVDNGSALPRGFMVIIQNVPGLSKTSNWLCARSTGAAATTGIITSGWGEYVNTSAALRSFQLLESAGASMLGTDTGFGVFGRNYT